MLIKNSKISDYEIKKIMRHFIVDITATQCAELLGFNRKTINNYYALFRTCILWNQHIEFQKAIH